MTSSQITIGNLDPKSFDFLQSALVSNLQRKDYELVTIDPEESAANALQILASNKISAAPIFDAKKQLFLGSISVMDLVIWIVRTYALSKNEESNDFDLNQIKIDMSRNVREISDWGLEPFWAIPQDESALSLINNFLKWRRIHRVPVVDPDGHVTGVVSQSDLTRFIQENQGRLEFVLSKTLKELRLEEGEVVSVLEDESLIKAFGTIVVTGFTGLAVVNHSANLVGNISASDLKGITLDNFQELNMPIKKFLNKTPVTLQRGGTLNDAISKLTNNKVHRIYVVDENNKPLSVISLTTVLRALGTPSEDFFSSGKLKGTPLPTTSL